MADTSPDDAPYDFAEPAPPPKPAPPPRRPPAPSQKSAPSPKPAPSVAAPELPLRVCLNCGHSFHGKRQARCPECAAPMDGAADLIQFADARWVRMVAWGLLLLVPAALLHLAGCGINRLDIYQNNDPNDHALAHLKGLLHGAAALLMTVGVFIATLRQPHVAAKGVGIRLASRVLSVAVLCVWLVAGAYALDMLKAQPGSYFHLKKMLTLLALLSQGALCIVLAFQCSRLAAAIPNDTLRTHSYYSGWLCAVVCATLFGLIALEMDRGDFPKFFMCSFPLIAGMLVILLWAMITLIRLALDLRTAAATGEEIAYQREQRAAARQSPPRKPQEWRELGEV